MKFLSGFTSLGPAHIPDVDVEESSDESVNANSLKNYVGRAVNFEVEDLADGDPFEHNLNSEKLAVSFYNTSGVQQYDVRWEPYDANNILIYLPTLESGGNTFTGEIFIQKRG